YRLVVPVRGAADDFVCSGEVSRIDLVPTGGYAAWFFVQELEPDWEEQLRFPIVQGTLARVTLKVPHRELRVGVYDFGKRRTVSRRYSSREIAMATHRLARLVRTLGF